MSTTQVSAQQAFNSLYTSNTIPLNASVTDLAQLVALQARLLTDFETAFNAGKRSPFIDSFSSLDTTPSLIYNTFKPVARAAFQNLSTTDTITVTTTGKPTVVNANAVSGVGVVLNPGAATGFGGGSLSVSNVDLSSYTFQTSTNSGQTIVVYYEQ